MKKAMSSALLVSLSLVAGVAMAQSATDDIAKYREMIADGNPSELYEAAGEDIWKKPMGPKSVSLEKCDLGKGPGVVKGAQEWQSIGNINIGIVTGKQIGRAHV